MPWPMIAGLLDEALKAIFAFLRSIGPIENCVPAAKVPVAAKTQVIAMNAKLLERHR